MLYPASKRLCYSAKGCFLLAETGLWSSVAVVVAVVPVFPWWSRSPSSSWCRIAVLWGLRIYTESFLWGHMEYGCSGSKLRTLDPSWYRHAAPPDPSGREAPMRYLHPQMHPTQRHLKTKINQTAPLTCKSSKMPKRAIFALLILVRSKADLSSSLRSYLTLSGHWWSSMSSLTVLLAVHFAVLFELRRVVTGQVHKRSTQAPKPPFT